MHKSLLSKWSWFNDRVKCDIAYWDGLCVFWKEILHHESLNPFWNWLAKHNKWWTPLYMLAITTCWWLEWCTVTRGNACNWKFNEKKIRINCKHVLYRFCIMNNLGKGKDIMREWTSKWQCMDNMLPGSSCDSIGCSHKYSPVINDTSV